jgi:glycosyltransferase involved in cell wall biosynthesis
MKKIFLSVVIPCFNEARNIRLGVLDKLYFYFQKQKYAWEVIFVDDGSTDESTKLINSFIKGRKNFILIKRPHQGKAGAVSAGVLKAKGEIVLFSDFDQATPINQIEKFFPWFEKGFDVVIGSRKDQRKGAPFLRKAMAKGFMLLRNLILDLKITDTQCGFKAFRLKAANGIIPKLQVFNLKRSAFGSTVSAGYDIELLYLAKIKGYKIHEIPVEWHYQETRHVNPVKDSLESLTDLVRIKINAISGKYK